MPRPKRINRPREKSISLPEDLVQRVDAHLYCPLEEKVPFGAWSQLVTMLLRQHMDKLEDLRRSGNG